MVEISSKVPRHLIEAELTSDIFQRKTNKAGNEIYVTTAHQSPNIMQEIGRLRELTFRSAGGGTGKAVDIDAYDTSEKPYKQLIVWDPEAKEILGGYRYILGNEIEYDDKKEPLLATARMFEMSNVFIKEYLSHTIELGRSFVQPDYQSSKAGAKALFALDNLWDGLGALTVDHPEIKYFFGKVTMYTHFNIEARDYILCFLNAYFKDHDQLSYPKEQYELKYEFSEETNCFTGDDFQEEYRLLAQKVRSLGENIPPLINAYMNLSPSMRVFGTAVNDHFGNVEETGIILTINDIYNAKMNRHIKTYVKSKDQFLTGIH